MPPLSVLELANNEVVGGESSLAFIHLNDVYSRMAGHCSSVGVKPQWAAIFRTVPKEWDRRHIGIAHVSVNEVDCYQPERTADGGT